MALYGQAECERMVNKLTDYAKSVLDGVFADTGFLRGLADSLALRKK